MAFDRHRNTDSLVDLQGGLQSVIDVEFGVLDEDLVRLPASTHAWEVSLYDDTDGFNPYELSARPCSGTWPISLHDDTDGVDGFLMGLDHVPQMLTGMDGMMAADDWEAPVV